MSKELREEILGAKQIIFIKGKYYVETQNSGSITLSHLLNKLIEAHTAVALRAFAKRVKQLGVGNEVFEERVDELLTETLKGKE